MIRTKDARRRRSAETFRMLGLSFFAAIAFALQQEEKQPSPSGNVQKMKRRKPRWWMRPWFQKRDDVEGANTLYHLRQEMQVCHVGLLYEKRIALSDKN